jgi:hypothetical protein
MICIGEWTTEFQQEVKVAFCPIIGGRDLIAPIKKMIRVGSDKVFSEYG